MLNLFSLFTPTHKQEADALIAKLKTIDKGVWLHIGHTLNGWEFPIDLYDVMPHWYLTNRSIKRAMKLISPVIKVIRDEFGNKEELRFHNVVRGSMSNLEFEYWYDNFSIEGSKNTGQPENTYYERSYEMDRLEWWKDEIWEKIKPLLKEDSTKR